ncbi:MAG: cupin domain-containing protein [Pseudomonadota bacterium]|nr:cupin domain-containing protein [Pseudomonadota bacterium]MED5406264.1 cupin domain-containing protein [Pseudomonadota bacterium]MEE3287533.1 cupin domain-containing protein [Pseudomonadota bacterium]
MTSRRQIINIFDPPYSAYDLEGVVQNELQFLNISYDRETQLGWYVIRMDPGASSIHHEHLTQEEFLILEGDLTESDGTCLKAGDFVSYPAGTSHNSTTENGCLLIGINRIPD